MDLDMKLYDMAGATPEHSDVVANFVAIVRHQMKESLCRAYGDNVQYKWKSADGEKTIIPDATINCRTHSRRGASFIDSPRFVMEVLSKSSEKEDRGAKKELYREQEIEEYWIVDWRNRTVEIYELDYKEDGTPEYFMNRRVTADNKNELKLLTFPSIKIEFDDLFYGV